MAKNAKESAQVKGRQTKLSKKTYEELIDIILRKDKTERNLSKQVKNLKGEVNTLQSRVDAFDKDMEGTYQSLETYKDKISTLNEQVESANTIAKDHYDAYLEENKKVISLTKTNNALKILFILSLGITLITIIVSIMC